MIRVRSTTVSCMILVLATACQPPAVSATGEWALTGVAVVTGRVVNTNGVPLDSFRIAGAVPQGGQALYSQGVTMVSGLDGRYVLRMERSGGAPPLSPDSVAMKVTVQSLKAVDRNTDGSARTVTQDVWVAFGRPPLPPATYSVDVAISVVR